MFVIELVYKTELTKIDAHMAAHVKFLSGIILAVGKSREENDRIVSEDPFHIHGLAEFRIIEFRASQRADDIQKRIDADAPGLKNRPVFAARPTPPTRRA